MRRNLTRGAAGSWPRGGLPAVRRWLVFGAAGGLAAGPLVAQLVAQQPAVRAPALTPLVIEDVTVIDVQDGRHLPHQTVVVTGTRIQAMGNAAVLRRPARARVVNGQGKYLIPGLWDMHLHPMNYPDVVFPLLLATGVTGYRDASSPVPLATMLRWRREIAAGTRIGPRFVLAGAAVDWSPYPRTADDSLRPYLRRFMGGNNHVYFNTAAEAVRLVDSLKAAGADFIKPYLTDRATYFAMAAEARRLGLLFGGHGVGSGLDEVTPLEMADSGVRFFDHSAGPKECGGNAATVEQCAAVVARLWQKGLWFVTASAGGPNRPYGVRFWPDSVYRLLRGDSWRENRQQAQTKFDTWTPALLDSLRRKVVATQGTTFSVLQRSGLVPLLAGTDDAPLFVPSAPGYSLQGEVIGLALRGLTPLSALQTATLNPALALNATDSLGTVAPGKLADLVLLDADPLTDITNIEQIRAVVANGRYYDRATLDGLVAAVERAARQ